MQTVTLVLSNFPRSGVVTSDGRGEKAETTARTQRDPLLVTVGDVVLLRTGAVDDVVDSGVSAAAILAIARVLAEVRGLTGDLSELAVPTEDGGLTLEFASAKTGREITFVVPDDASVLYFITCGDGDRRSGVVVDRANGSRLALWAAGKQAFPTAGITVGSSRA